MTNPMNKSAANGSTVSRFAEQLCATANREGEFYFLDAADRDRANLEALRHAVKKDMDA